MENPSVDFYSTIDVYFKLFAIVTLLFFTNYLIARYGYGSGRLHSGEALADRLNFAAFYMLPMTIFPWLFFLFPSKLLIILASWITVLLFSLIISTLIVGLVKNLSGGASVFSYIGWRGLIIISLIATALLPLSLGMYLFTDQAVAFRRVVFASMFFWFTVLATAFLFLERLKGMYHYVMQLGFVVVVLSLLAGVAAIMDMSTQQVAAREWFAATCASRIAPLSEPARVSRTEALKAIALPFPQALSSDELQVRTIFYPSGAMLIWLSHLDAQRKAFSPWKLRFTDELSSSNWNLAFAKCAAEYKE
jgi:hypothetical protein